MTTTVKAPHVERVSKSVDEILSNYPDILLPIEVSRLMRLNPRSIGRLVLVGTFRTIGGHKRYLKTSVRDELIRRMLAEEAKISRKEAAKK